MERPTGYRHNRCYANGDSNCSTKISKEHFISANLLRRIQLNDTAKIAGLAWQEREKFDIVPIKSLASNILCKRHNEALNPLDAVVGSFADTIKRFDRREPARNDMAHFSGSDIERWMLKCLLGLTASGNLRSGLKPECIDLLFQRREWSEDWGMYFSMDASRQIYHTDSLLIETRTTPDHKLILACHFYVQGLPFILVLGKPGNPASFGVWRPKEIRFEQPACKNFVSLSWNGNRCGEAVTLKRVGTYNGPPPTWEEWEKQA